MSRNPDPAVRARVVDVARQLPPNSARPLLRRFIDDPDEKVKALDTKITNDLLALATRQICAHSCSPVGKNDGTLSESMFTYEHPGSSVTTGFGEGQDAGELGPQGVNSGLSHAE
jgi:hypothetical protein